MHQRQFVTIYFLNIGSAYPDSVLFAEWGFFIAFCRNLTVFFSPAIIFSLFPIREDRTKKPQSRGWMSGFGTERQQSFHVARPYSRIATDETFEAATGRLRNAGVSFFA